MQRLLLFGILFTIVVGCGRGTDMPAQSSTKPIPDAQESRVTRRVAELSDRDRELIEFILRKHSTQATDRIYFLTTTPMSKWGDHADWVSMSDSLHDRVSDLPEKYRPASDAMLKDGTVYEKPSNKQSWMQWVTIKRWISGTEVEVEEGVWCCPLGGGASTITYEKVDDEWQIKGFGPMWVS